MISKLPEKEKLRVFFEKETNLPSHYVLQSKLLVSKEEEGKVIGLAGVQKNNSLFVVVTSKYQDTGIGTELTKETVRQAIKRNYSYISLTVSQSNIKAFHIFQKLGFKPVYSWLNNGKKFHFMILTLNWRGKLAKNIFFIRHQFHFLNKLSNILLHRIQNHKNKQQQISHS